MNCEEIRWRAKAPHARPDSRRNFARILLALLFTSALGAVIVDRIAITVGTQVITESELELSLHLTAFLNQDPVNLSIENRRKAAERLIDQKLVLKELDFSKFPRPSMDEVQPRLATLQKTLFQEDAAAYRAALAKYGLSEDDLKRHLLWQITFFRFVDFRFRPGVEVNDTDVEEYFKSKILPLAQKTNPGKTISIDEYRDRIERILAARREDGEMQVWLRDTRARTTIEYRDETLQPLPKPQSNGTK
jgi:hypothetical protein